MPTSSTSDNKKLTTDLYEIADYVGEIQADNMDGVSSDTLMLGIFGYMREVFSQTIQNTIIMASEFANEGIATKAKFEKNIIAHALGLGITNINAVPAQIEVYLTFIEDEIINALGGGSGDFIFDRDNQIYFDDLEFHPDYDIIIRRVRLSNGEFTYTAMYDMQGDGIYENPISDITNPYLTPPIVMAVNGTRYLFTSCLLRQVEKTTIYKKVLSDNTISSKTVNFTFDSQLAGFDVDVTNANGSTHLTPVYEGLSSSGTRYAYVWYTYLDADNIRIKFDRNSYYPRINTDVEIHLQTTQGERGNFTWSGTDYPSFYFDSERLGYTNIFVQVRPINNESMYGMDKKTGDELKEIIPKEALSRGSITNTTDLQNYFNAIDTDSSKMYFYKRRDNCLERLYYSYIVMKDATNNIVPTNTVAIEVDPSALETDKGSGKLILKRGQILKLSADGNTCTLFDGDPTQEPDYTDGFYYIIPYNFAINLDPMYGMYFLTTMNVNKNLGFTYINEECQFQYIATYINWNRKYLTETDTYVLTMNVAQNITADNTMITVDADGNITSSNVKAYIVFYNDEDEPIRYAEGTIGNFSRESGTFDFTFKFTSNDLIDSENHIRIAGLDQAGFSVGEGLDYAYLPGNTKAMIHIITYQPEFSTDTYYDDILGNTHIDIRDIIPIVDGWCITNSYEVLSGIDFFYNYSEIVYSNIEMIGKEDQEPVTDPDDPYAEIKNIDVTINGENYRFESIGDKVTQQMLSRASIEEFILDRYEEGEVATFDRTYADPAQTVNQIRDIQFDLGDGTSLTLQYVPREPDPEPGESDDPEAYSYYFRIHNVPLIKYDYFRDESMVEFFCSELVRRKSYIDQAIENLEDSFGMDFKFFNTYGPSKMYTLDGVSNYLNRVNLSLTFRLGLQVNYDENIVQYITDDVKEFVENINEITSVHMSNLVADITAKYEESITFFEFMDFNGYGPGEQHLYAMQMPDDVRTPELVNVNIILPEMTPDINIIIA